MRDLEEVIKGLEVCVSREPGGDYICDKCPYEVDGNDCEINSIKDAIALLKEQEAVVRCKDCENWIPGYITDHDDFIPPKCGKYQQMVGHSADDYCSLVERKESR